MSVFYFESPTKCTIKKIEYFRRGVQKKQYKISKEFYKFPYNKNYRQNLVLQIVFFAAKICKKITTTTKSNELYLKINTGAIVPAQVISLTASPQTSAIIKSVQSNADLLKQAVIFQIIKEMLAKFDFTPAEFDKLYFFSVKCENNSLS